MKNKCGFRYYSRNQNFSARIFHEMDLPDMQGAECKAVRMYRASFWNAADPVKPFCPQFYKWGDNL